MDGLRQFIEDSVLCSKCGNPETKFIYGIKENGKKRLYMDCLACSHSKVIRITEKNKYLKNMTNIETVKLSD